MNFFNTLNRTAKDKVADLEKSKKPVGGKLFKIVNTICILSIFIALGVGVLGAFGLLEFTPATFGIIGTIAVLCIGCWLMLPWVACLEQKKHKKLSVFFICLDIAIPVFWIVAIWVLVAQASAETVGTGTLNFIKAVFLISMQFSLVSLIANTHLRYGKKLLVVQIIAYVSFIYFDFYVSYALCCVGFSQTDGIVFSEALSVLGNKIMLSLFILSFLYVVIAFAIINGGRKRIRRLGDGAVETLPDDDAEQKEGTSNATLEEQLQALQNLRDKNLITQEEYEEKRKAIIARW